VPEADPVELEWLLSVKSPVIPAEFVAQSFNITFPFMPPRLEEKLLNITVGAVIPPLFLALLLKITLFALTILTPFIPLSDTESDLYCLVNPASVLALSLMIKLPDHIELT